MKFIAKMSLYNRDFLQLVMAEKRLFLGNLFDEEIEDFK